MTAPRTVRTLQTATAVAVAVTTLALAGCRPEPGPTASPSPTVTGMTPRPLPSGPTPIETEKPDAGFSLPSSCDDVYSDAMRASLEAQNPPLNDPGVTMLSTQVVDALEVLESGIPTIRCSWGEPGEVGLSTNVSVVTADQTEALEAALRNAGFGCGDELGGTVCRIEQRSIDLDDEEVVQGEVHVLRDGAWIATHSVNFQPDGYTEDIVATLWG